MQIIFGKENAKTIGEKYTLLELETFYANDKPIETYCVIPTEKLAFSDVGNLEHNIKLHNDFLSALKEGNYKLCKDLYPHLIGKFGGEVDSFYDEIMTRC